MSDRLTKLLELLKEMPRDTFLKYGVALEYMSRNEDETAIQHFTELQTAQPEYLPLYYQLGKLYERTDQTENAIKTYNEGVIVARKQKDMHTMMELQNAMEELL